MNEPDTTSPGDLPSPERPKKKRRWLRRIVLLLVVLLVLGGLFIGLLPSILSSSWGVARIEAAASESLGRPVAIEALRFSWSGEQSIRGLRVGPPARAPGGEAAADGGAEDLDLLRVDVASVSVGPFDLIGGLDRLEVRLERPVVRVRRDASGRFSFDDLLGDAKEGEGEEAPPESGETPKGGGDESDEKAGSLPFEVVFALRGGELHYDDEKEGVASRVTGLDVDLHAKKSGGAGEKAEVEFAVAAKVGAPSADAPGEIDLDGRIVARVGASEEIAESLVIEGAARGIDLRPYAPLIERLTGVRPPDAPIEGDFVVRTEDGMAKGSLRLDGGYARVGGEESGTFELPLSGQGRARARIPFGATLGPLVSALGEKSGLPPGSVVEGLVDAVLVLDAELTPSADGSESVPASAELRLELTTDDLVLILPPGEPEADAVSVDPKVPVDPKISRDPRDGDRPVDPQISRDPVAEPEPLEIREKKVRVALEVRAVDALGAFEIAKAAVVGEGLRLELGGRIAGVDAKLDATEAYDLDLTFAGRASLPQLVERVAGLFPEGVQLSEKSAARIEGGKIRGRYAPDVDPLESLAVEMRAILGGGGLSYSGLDVNRLSADVRVADGKAVASNVAIGLNGGSLAAPELMLELGGDTPAFRAKLDLSSIDLGYELAPILSYALPFLGGDMDPTSLSGKLAGSLSIEGKGFGLADLKRHLEGAGSLRVLDGEVRSSPFFRALGELLSSDVQGVLFEAMGTDFTIGKGQVESSEVYLESKSGKMKRVGLAGRTSFDRELDYSVKLSMLEEAIGDREAKQALAIARRVLGIDALPLALGGDVSAPRLRLDLEALRIDDPAQLLRGAAEGVLRGDSPLGDILRGGARRSGGDGEKKKAGEGEGGEAGSEDASSSPRSDPRDALEAEGRRLLRGVLGGGEDR